VAKRDAVPRPRKRVEFEILFVTSHAHRGCLDLLANQRNAVVDAWDRLTKTPRLIDPKCCRLKGELASVVREGVAHDQWQLELHGGARIWYYIEEQTVNVVAVHTRHPNQTK
jgi:hypothetical protein